MRPVTPYAEFEELPVIEERRAKWKNLRIVLTTDGRGYALECYECVNGLLIPMGGVQIAFDECYRRITEREVQRYMCSMCEYCFDGDPSICWKENHVKYLWPGMYANECTAGNPAQVYNCLLVFIDTEQVTVPMYPGIPRTRYMPFLEVMVPIRRKWTELFVWYGDDETYWRYGYSAKHFWLSSSRALGMLIEVCLYCLTTCPRFWLSLETPSTQRRSVLDGSGLTAWETFV